MLRIWLFGGARFSVADGDVVVPKGAPAQRLLAYLALTAGRETPKEQAANHIWGQGKVGDNFRRALSDLRRGFSDAGLDPAQYISSVEGRTGHLGTIGLAGEVWVDALEFRQLWESQPAEALKLARGSFLGEMRDPGPWLTVRRDQYLRMVANAYGQLATEAWGADQRAQAIIFAELRHETLPDNPEAISGLMELLAKDGQRRATIELGERFLLEHPGDEVGLAPVRELVDRARRGEIDVVPRTGAVPRGAVEAEAGVARSAAVRGRRAPSPRVWVLGGVLAALAVGGIAFAMSRPDGDANPELGFASASCDPADLTEPSAADRAAVEVAKPAHSAPRSVGDIVTRSRPRAIVAASDGIWLAQSTDGSIWRIDPEIAKPVGEPFPVRGTPYTLAVAKQAIWVTRDDGVLVELDRSSGRVERQISFGPGSGSLALGAGSVWVNIYDGKHRGDVARIDPCSGDVEYIDVGEGANTVVYAYGAIWVSDSRARELHRLDPETEEVQDVALDVTDPQDVGAGDGFIWIAHYGPKRLTRVDPKTLTRVGQPIPIGPGAAGVAVGAGAVWIPNYEGDSVTRVDLKTLESDPDAVRVGDSPTDLAIGSGRLWVTNNDAEPPTVTEIRP